MTAGRLSGCVACINLEEMVMKLQKTPIFSFCVYHYFVIFVIHFDYFILLFYLNVLEFSRARSGLDELNFNDEQGDDNVLSIQTRQYFPETWINQELTIR